MVANLIHAGAVSLVAFVCLAATGCCCGDKEESSGSSTAAPDKGGSPSVAMSADQWIAKAKGVSGCSAIAGDHAVSVQASTAFGPSGMVKLMAGEGLKDQHRQSFQCGSQKVGLFAYEYSAADKAKSAEAIIGAFMWGPEGRSSVHPGRIKAKADTVIVISLVTSSPLDSLL